MALTVLDSLYFSVTTAATVGYGDIVPNSAIAKVLVMAELVANLFFVIGIFSVATTYVRDREA